MIQTGLDRYIFMWKFVKQNCLSYIFQPALFVSGKQLFIYKITQTRDCSKDPFLADALSNGANTIKLLYNLGLF